MRNLRMRSIFPSTTLLRVVVGFLILHSCGFVGITTAQKCTDTTTKHNTYANVKTVAAPEVANHPATQADIVFGTEASNGDHAYMRDGVLGGFDIELTNAVCKLAGKTCAIVTVCVFSPQLLFRMCSFVPVPCLDARCIITFKLYLRHEARAHNALWRMVDCVH